MPFLIFITESYNQTAMKKLIFLFLLLMTLPLFGQDRCGTDVLFEQQLQDPKFKRSYLKLEKIAKEAEEAKRASSMPDLPITVPVIVHIIHLGEPYGVDNHLPIEYVQEAIDNANQNFAGEFSDDPTANTEIDFCIANLSTSGAPIEGIRYYNWDDLGFGDISDFYLNNVNVSNLIGYDRSNYCNIFVAPFTSPLGFAYLAPSNYGVFVGTNYFGITGYQNNYALNRTLVHELGHYCGLFHTFHNTSTCNPTGNCVSQGDAVCDTPPTTGSAGCGPLSCPETLVENFMDYSNDQCMDSFTQGQALRMLSRLETARPGVVNNTLACGAIDGVDAGVSGVTIPNLGCDPTQDIEFILTSYGDTLTETTINYTINGEELFMIWTGNLGFGESETITIPNFEVGYGLVDIEINVDALGDVYADNNTQSVQLDNYEGSLIDINIQFDALPYGFHWVLYEADSLNNPIGDAISGVGSQTYTNADYSCESETYSFCLPEGNYVLVLEDIFGNGLHYYCVDNPDEYGLISIISGNDTLNSIQGGWADGEPLPFYVIPSFCPPNDCPWDVDGNGFVWVSDILQIIQYYGLEVEPCNQFDINQDGVVGVDDILDAIANFDTECGTGLMSPPLDSFRRLVQEAGEEVVTQKLYNLQGQEVQYNDYLDTGIYFIVQEWTNGFVISKKIYHQQH